MMFLGQSGRCRNVAPFTRTFTFVFSWTGTGGCGANTRLCLDPDAQTNVINSEACKRSREVHLRGSEFRSEQLAECLGLSVPPFAVRCEEVSHQARQRNHGITSLFVSFVFCSRWPPLSVTPRLSTRAVASAAKCVVQVRGRSSAHFHD